MAHGGRARGEMGGGHQRAVWEQFLEFWAPLKQNPNNWSDLAGDEGEAWGDGGRRGEVAHGGRASGGDGEKQQNVHSSLKNLTWSDLAGDAGGGMGGRRGEVAHAGRGRGGD